jgi:hypothetical protein
LPVSLDAAQSDRKLAHIPGKLCAGAGITRKIKEFQVVAIEPSILLICKCKKFRHSLFATVD